MVGVGGEAHRAPQCSRGMLGSLKAAGRELAMVWANSSESNTPGDGAQSPGSAKLCAHDGETTERCLSRIMQSGKASRRRSKSEGRGRSRRRQRRRRCRMTVSEGAGPFESDKKKSGRDRGVEIG